MTKSNPANPILIPLLFPHKNDHRQSSRVDNDETNATNDNSIFSLSSSSSPSKDEHNIPKWALIEINGELITPNNVLDYDCSANLITSNSALSPCYELGSVHFLNEKEPVMIIGSHELKGYVQELKQPFCVLQKRQQKNTDKHSYGLNLDKDSSNLAKSAEVTTHYNVIGIVTVKLLFDKYPKAIVRQSF